MAEVKFKQTETHTVFVTKVMVADTADWEGNELVTEEELKTYIAEGTTGDDDTDDKCFEQLLNSECVDEEEPDWWSDRKGCTEVERELLDD